MLLVALGLSFVVDQLDCSSMGTAYTTIMHVQICPASCRPHSSSDTWHAFAMASFLCLGLLVSVQHSFLSAIYTVQLSVSSKFTRCTCFLTFMIHGFGRTILSQRGLCRAFLLKPILVISYYSTIGKLVKFCICNSKEVTFIC